MASCPTCHNQLQTDFGNEVCTKCGATVFVESDEIVHVQNLAAMDAALNESQETESLEAIKSMDLADELSETDDPIFGRDTFATENTAAEIHDVESFNEPLSENTENDVLGDDFSELSLSTESSIEDQIKSNDNSDIKDSIFESGNEKELQVPSAVEVATTAEDFLSEMQLLGDMASEKFKESNYFFDIEITGIDSKDVRDEILDHLFDSRLGLKENNLDKKIKNGFLIIHDVSAVKTHVIVQRLSHLPCEISWKIKEAHELGAAEAEVVIEDESLGVESLDVDEFADIEEV